MSTTKKSIPSSMVGSLFIIASAVAFGSYGVFSRYLGSYDIFYQTYVRCFLVAAMLAIVGVVKHQFKPIARKDWGWFATVLLFTSFSIAPITYAYRFLTLGVASFLYYSSVTVFSYLSGFLFFKEKWTRIKMVSLGLSVVGMLLIFSFQTSAVLLVPALLVLFNGLASSGEVTFSKKISNSYSSTQITFLIFAVIGISHLLLSLVVGETQDTRLFTQSFPIMLLFVVAALFGMITVVEGFKRVEPSIGAILGLTEIVFSVVIGIVLFAEKMTLPVLLGGACILIAAILPNIQPLMQYFSSRQSKVQNKTSTL